jgi:L-lactate dehydrogenase complex protein LldG
MNTNNLTAREKILERLRLASRAAQTQKKPKIQKKERISIQDNPLSKTLSLSDQLQKNRFEVIVVRNDTLPQILSAIVEKIVKSRPLSWLLGNGSVNNNIVDHLQKIDRQTVHQFDRPFETLKDSIFNDIDIGLTHCEAIIKDTGTFVIQPSADEPRTLSLIPPIHVVIANKAAVFDSLRGYFAHEIEQSLIEHSNLIFVSSPSKTADIQQKLAYGAHGPKRVIVVLSDQQLNEE